ncbi:MAG TPA: triose-phosphate isomerase [Rickettsiales bacterium]|nr:triose-phosphate isomerase [Rickettsiales bacterium]
MKYILGNWKMNATHAEAAVLARTLAALPVPGNVKTALFPPFTSLHIVAEAASGSALGLGAQDCSIEEKGAFTGEISASMLKDSGCNYVIVGHSERRTLHGETSATVKRKAEAAIRAGLVPVICVGEHSAERESGNYLQVISRQVEESLPALACDMLVIAYEPVWAIGTGKIPSVSDITEVHKTIASLLYRATSVAVNAPAKTAIVYGGSVKAANAREILAAEAVDGVLVGGASLNADEFGKIIESAGSLG